MKMTRNTAQKSPSRYSSPTLKVYGHAIELTASGTQDGTEGSGSGNIVKKL
jgi:hypothetical protein